jgi:hypothetical protein
MRIEGFWRLSNTCKGMAASAASSPGMKRSSKARWGAMKFNECAGGEAAGDAWPGDGELVRAVSAIIGKILG